MKDSIAREAIANEAKRIDALNELNKRQRERIENLERDMYNIFEYLDVVYQSPTALVLRKARGK